MTHLSKEQIKGRRDFVRRRIEPLIKEAHPEVSTVRYELGEISPEFYDEELVEITYESGKKVSVGISMDSFHAIAQDTLNAFHY